MQTTNEGHATMTDATVAAIGDPHRNLTNAAASLDVIPLGAVTHEDLSTTEIAELRVLLHRIMVRATDLATAIDVALSLVLDADLEVPGMHAVIRRQVTRRKTWNDDGARERMFDDARRAIMRKVSLDPATGALDPVKQWAASETFAEVADAFSLGPDPKVAFRRRLGLDPADYRSTDEVATVKVETVE